MQFQVPQFIDVEDKIIGPFTIKQFLYTAGGVGLLYLAGSFIPYVGWIIGLVLLVFGLALAFYKYNGRPFVLTLEAAWYYVTSSRFYVWKRREKRDQRTSGDTSEELGTQLLAGKKRSDLDDLSMSVDAKTKVATQKVHRTDF
jgi:hypothetical protein